MAGDFWVNGYGTSTGGYVPTTTTVTVTPTPAICPDCGRCRTCGQPKSVEVKPVWNWNTFPIGTGYGTYTGNTDISLTMSDALAGEVR